MKGFFDSKTYKKKDGRKVRSCASCGLLAKTPLREPQGKGGKGILMILDKVSDIGIKRGDFLKDKHGKFLKSQLQNIGIDTEQDTWVMAACACPSKAPTNYQYQCCQHNIEKAIQKLKPNQIICFGNNALRAVIGGHYHKEIGEITKFEGANIPDQIRDCWISVLESPEKVNIQKNYKNIYKLWQNQLETALTYSAKNLPLNKVLMDRYKVIENGKEQVKFFRWLSEQTAFTTDIETTGLKPYNTDIHQIIIIGFAVNDFAYVMEYPTGKAFALMKKVLGNPKIKKTAQNMKYEHTWFKVISGIDVKGWEWDTMQAQHIIDNRVGITGLKFQSYIRLGIADYSSHISKFLQAGDSNSVNGIVEAMQDYTIKADLMKYCALDCMWTEIIKNQQKGEMSSGQMKAYNLFHEGILSLAEAEWQGMRIDIGYIYEMYDKIDSDVKEMEHKLQQSDFIKNWKKLYKDKMNTGSGMQLGEMLYNQMGLEPVKLTASGKGSTDENSLKQLNVPELDMILNIKKRKKLKATYLKNFEVEAVNGFVHPNFNLHTVRTYRSSSNSPNFQNIPKRDKEAMKITRDAIFPRKGHQLMEADFSKLEVSIAACYHKDPAMIEYLTSDHNDMHGDLAQQIFFISDKDWDKHSPCHSTLRAATKNSFIFPQFYGDYYKNNAEGLRQWVELGTGVWKPKSGILMDDGTYLSDHMQSNGIKHFNDFVEHLKEIEYDFWNNRFKAYGKWKQKWMKLFEKKGYFDMKSGFRVSGDMRQNEVINYPVQGAAFHCLMWSFIQINKELKEKKMDTKLIGQIHDAIILDVHPEELDEACAILKRITTVDLPKAWEWIIVPLQIEAELCGVDESWATKKDYDLTKY